MNSLQLALGLGSGPKMRQTRTSAGYRINMQQVVLSLVIIFCAFIKETNALSAPVYGIKSQGPGTINSDDFIVVLKNHSCNFTSLKDRWHHRYFSDGGHYKYHRNYRFARFAAARLRMNNTVLRSLQEDPAVKYIEVNKKIYAEQTSMPDPCQNLVDGSCMQQSTGSSLWGLSRTSSKELPAYANAKYTFLSGDGAGVDVYVIDTGVLPTHSEFEGRASVAFVSTELAAEGKVDLHGHGTHVSGTIAGKTYGLAKYANIIGVKVLGKDGVGTLGGLLEGLEWVHQDFLAKQKASQDKSKAVVNLSLGGSPGEIQSLDEAAITIISEIGLPFVVAAGNDDTDACLVSPARVSVAITVGSTNKNDILSSFSNSGPCVDMLAPGEMILSSYIGSTTTTATMSGTSMATPHVTGVVARYLSQSCITRPSPAAIKAWLQDTSTKTAVDLQDKLSTPNRLLYMFCLAGELFGNKFSLKKKWSFAYS